MIAVGIRAGIPPLILRASNVECRRRENECPNRIKYQRYAT